MTYGYYGGQSLAKQIDQHDRDDYDRGRAAQISGQTFTIEEISGASAAWRRGYLDSLTLEHGD